MSLGDFFSIVWPVGALSLVWLSAAVILNKGGEIEFEPCGWEGKAVDKRLAVLYGALFGLSILTVLRLCDYRWCLGLTVAAVLIFDRAALIKKSAPLVDQLEIESSHEPAPGPDAHCGPPLAVDYALLGTFVAFFIFVGNLSSLPAVKETLSNLISEREMMTAIGASQIVSNVPAAVMLSGFTDNVRELLLGVNLGGLGTLIASLASLISYKIYAKSPGARPWLFLGIFSVANGAMLAVLVLSMFVLGPSGLG